MTKQDFMKEMNEELEFEPNTLENTEFLLDLPLWDSMQRLVFIAKTEEKTGVVIEGTDISKAKTVDELIGLLNGKLE